MSRGLVFLPMIALSIVSALLLVGGQAGGSALCYVAFFVIWLAAGRPRSLLDKSGQKSRRPAASQPETPAQIVSPSIGGAKDDDIVGSFSRLDPQWRDFLNGEAETRERR